MALMYMLKVEVNDQIKTIINETEEKFNQNISVANAKGYKIIKKTKLYPVGRWDRYQHVFYNANDRAWNVLHDAQDANDVDAITKASDWVDTVQKLLGRFDAGPQDANGIVYAEYEDYKIMKDIIGGYMYRHGGTV